MDTNVLLDLYRLSAKSREDLMKSIDFFGERIWLPYQAGLEFHRNREHVIKDLGGSMYEEFQKTLDDFVVKSKEAFKNYQRHPCINYEYIEKRIERFKEDLEKKAVGWKDDYPYNKENDDILKWVTEKYDGKVGEDNTTDELLAIFKEGETRYRAQVPQVFVRDNHCSLDEMLAIIKGKVEANYENRCR